MANAAYIHYFYFVAQVLVYVRTPILHVNARKYPPKSIHGSAQTWKNDTRHNTLPTYQHGKTTVFHFRLTIDDQLFLAVGQMKGIKIKIARQGRRLDDGQFFILLGKKGHGVQLCGWCGRLVGRRSKGSLDFIL